MAGAALPVCSLGANVLSSGGAERPRGPVTLSHGPSTLGVASQVLRQTDLGAVTALVR